MRHTRVTTAVAAALLASGLAACGSQTPGGLSDQPSVPQSTAYTTDANAEEAPEGDPNAPLVVSLCGQGLGPWGFQGKLQNSGEAEKEYVVRVEITKTEGGEVVASEDVSATVPGGETVEVEALDIYSGDEEEGVLDCEVNIVPEG